MDLFIDSCAVERLTEAGYQSEDIAALPFKIHYTPDLKREYEQKLCSNTTAAAKDVAKFLLSTGALVSFFGFSEENSADPGPCLGWGQGLWASHEQSECIDRIRVSIREGRIPKNRTDAYLVAIAQYALVLTDNSNDPHWKTAPLGPGRVIFWRELLPHLNAGRNLADTLIILSTAETDIVSPITMD